jgi:hypothetical protein
MYYIFFNNELQSGIIDEMWDDNMLGDESFGKFYIGGGYIALNNIINNEPELLERVEIRDEQGKEHSVTEFLDKIEKWKIMS